MRWRLKNDSKKKQDSFSQTVPLGDREDPTAGSEEALELQMDTPEGEADIRAGEISVAGEPGRLLELASVTCLHCRPRFARVSRWRGE